MAAPNAQPIALTPTAAAEGGFVSEILRPQRDAIPAELRDRPQWVLWRMETRGGDSTKVPYTRGGGKASSTNPKTWLPFEEAWELYTASGNDGVGFVFSADDPYTGIDLDAVVPQAEKDEIVEALNSYTETSPSRRGLHIITRATVLKSLKKDGVEVYSSGRFFTVTGARVAGPLPTIEARQAEVNALCSRLRPRPATEGAEEDEGAHVSLSNAGILAGIFSGPQGDKLQKKWEADQSEGDAELVYRIMKTTGHDRDWIEQIMRASPFARDKYDELRGGETYVRYTIRRILQRDPQPQAGRVGWTTGDKVKIREVDWLWHNRMPLGSLTLISGQPGLGKSTLTFWIAAEVTRGTLPGALQGAPHPVIIASAEDQLDTVIAPRLRAAGADMSLVHLPTHEKETLLEKMGRLRSKIQETGARLVILDPMNAFIPTNINTWKDAEVRRILAPLAGLADESNAAIILVSHLNKGSKGNNTDVFSRVGGSIGFSGAARAMFLVVPDHDSPEGDGRLFGHVKSNMGVEQLTRRFRVVPTTVCQPNDGDGHYETVVPTSKVAWGEEFKMPREELLSTSTVEERQGREECKAWIREILAAGPMPSKQFEAQGLARGFSARTMTRARHELRVRSAKTSGSGAWSVSLGPTTAQIDAGRMQQADQGGDAHVTQR